MMRTCHTANIVANRTVLSVLALWLGASCALAATASKSTEIEQLRKAAFRHTAQQEFDQAIPLLERAHELAKQQNDTRLAVLLRNNVAGCLFGQARWPEATRHYQAAWEASKVHALRDLETLVGYNLASLFLSTGQAERAQATILQFPLDGSSMQSDSRLEGFLLQGAIFARLRLHERARQSFERALAEAEREPSLRLRSSQPDYLSQWPEAARELRRAKAYSAISQALAQLGEWKEAEGYALEAFRLRWLYRDTSRSRDLYTCARVARQQKQYDAALRLLETAKQSSTRQRVPVQDFLNQREVALTLLAAGRQEEALEPLRNALRIVRQLRLNVLPANSAGLHFESYLHNELYEAFFAAVAKPDWAPMAPEFAGESFWMAEEARFASLQSQPQSAEWHTEQLPARYWQLLATYQAWQTAGLRHAPVDSVKLQQLEAELAHLEIQSGLSMPRSTAAGTPHFEQWQKGLANEEVVYAFHLAEPKSLLWVVQRNGIRMHRIAGRNKLQQLIGGLRSQLGSTREAFPSPEAVTLSREIFRDFPQPKGTIPIVTLVLDQELHDLPFAVLPSILNEKRFLLRDAVLRVAPSTAMPARAKASAWNRRAVAVADPVYNRADGRIQKVASAAVLGLNRLPGSGREAESAMRTLAASGWETASYAGPEANPDQLRRLMEQSPDVLHVAAHFLRTQDNSPWLGLALSPDQSQTSIFGLADMRLLKTNSRVVVLSGCETQGGTVFPGLGVNGLARNFLVAGAESVLVTLWPIEDSAGPLFPVLYQQLVSQRPGPLALPRALRAAQLALLDSGQWSGRPDYWAAYVAITRG